MARILVTFATTDGQTAKIARAIAARFTTLGHQADLVDAAVHDVSPRDYDAVVAAGSIHVGGYQRALARWVHDRAPQLNGRPTAFVSVCLGVLQREAQVQRDLAAIATKFLDAAGWQPLEVKMVAGALKYTQYNPLERWAMKRIAAKAGGDTDTSRDYEYTDWADVDRFVDRFAARLAPAGVAHVPDVEPAGTAVAAG